MKDSKFRSFISKGKQNHEVLSEFRLVERQINDKKNNKKTHLHYDNYNDFSSCSSIYYFPSIDQCMVVTRKPTIICILLYMHHVYVHA